MSTVPGTAAEQSTYADRKVTQMPQLELFNGLLLPTDKPHPYSNSFALYDLAPKYVFHAEERENGKYLPIVQRPFEYADVGYEVEVRPARIRVEGVEREFYPGEREQVVEEVLRRIAIEKRRTTIIDESAGLKFSLYELRQELIRVGHSYTVAEIKEALEIGHLSNVLIRKTGASKPEVSASIFPIRAVNEPQPNGDVFSYVSFNPLVTEAIRNLDFRLYNYELSMRLNLSVARWLHKRLSHCFIQASISSGFYNINATTIMRDSGMGSYTRERDAFRTIERAVAELKAGGVLNNYKATDVRGPRQRLIEVKYMLFPSMEFAAEQKKANWMRNRIEENHARNQNVVEMEPRNAGRSVSRVRPALPAAGGTKR